MQDSQLHRSKGSHHLEDPVYDSVGEGVIAISDKVLLADNEIMISVQFPKLQSIDKMSCALQELMQYPKFSHCDAILAELLRIQSLPEMLFSKHRTSVLIAALVQS